ncbi:hypothetical protein MYX07_04765 [Patescibacteria group bacterium AH-259-L07]|nr:hypothetical protein [Patescibacteria group bacterium AH-259-L07]
MATILDITAEHNPGLCDSDTGESCVTEKVVDVTEECPGANEKERRILLYTRARRGRIVQITHPYKGKEYMGSHIHFFVDELDAEMHVAPGHDTFGSWASELGLDKSALRTLIETHAPPA